jgi:rhomboid protease GluP
MNLYALLYIGVLLEPHLGKVKFLTAFLLTGIAASVNSFFWHPLTVSAGASGAIFGLYGVYLALLTTNHIERAARKTMLTSIGVFVAYNLLNGLKGGIDNAAHIGGLLSGLMIGYSFYPAFKKSTSPRFDFFIVPLLIIGICFGSFFAIKKVDTFGTTVQGGYQIDEYKKKMDQFASMEFMALEVLQMDGNSPRYEIQREIQERGLYYWQENIRVIKEADELILPEVFHKRNKHLLDYCNLRIKSYNLLHKSLEPGGEQYQRDLLVINNEIEYIIRELKSSQGE